MKALTRDGVVFVLMRSAGFSAFLVAAGFALVSVTSSAEVPTVDFGRDGSSSRSVTKTNPKTITMHYMPWFETPETLGGENWGIHWEMANRDPNRIEADGQRQIASHYYPLIGPYASRDPDVIEYHLLLMKLSGVDAVSIDWYGVAGSNGDIDNLLTNANALIDRVGDFGLEFNVVLEDRFARSVQDVKTNVAYLRDHYFNRPEYLRVGAADNPLLKVFGPATVRDPAEWPAILAEAGEDVELLTLWYRSSQAGASADGEFAWIEENEAFDDFLAVQQFFLQNHSPTLGTAVGTAFPGSTITTTRAGWSRACRSKSPTTTARPWRRRCDYSTSGSPTMSTWCNSPPGTTSARARCSSPPSSLDSTISCSY